jgi:hypothetical protein
MATRQTFASEIQKRARAMGWTVTFTRNGEPTIWNPNNPEKGVAIHLTPSDVNASKRVMQKLDEIGFSEAEQEWARLKEEDRQQRLKVVREKNQSDLDKAQKYADSLAKASGQARVTLQQLVSPYPVPKTFERVLITPEWASALLDLNKNNRPIRQPEVMRWVNTIESGNWHYTHQGIALDTEAILQDGQHRLTAIVVSGIPCEMQVSVGMPPENFSAIDNGLRRTFGDVVARRGFGSRNRVGTAARLVLIYDEYPRRALTSKVSNAEVDAYIMKPFDADRLTGDVLQLASAKAQLMWRACRLNASAAAAGVYKLYDLIGEDDPAVVEFIDGIITGENLPGDDARQVLRTHTNKPGTQNRTAWHHLGLFIKAWNKFITGQEVKQLSLRKTEDLPSFQIPVADASTSASNEESSSSTDDDSSFVVPPVTFSATAK